jgi:hypothetical protein
MSRPRFLSAVVVAWGLAASPAARSADDLSFEVAVMPEFQRHAELFAHPGYAAIALESIGLSPSLSSKLVVKERGKSVGTRYGTLRFVGRKDALYSYEAAISAGDTGAHLTVPVTVDASSLSAGKIMVTIRPPLASLIPSALTDRIQVKIRMVANATAQKTALGYLDSLAKAAGSEGGTLFEALLLDSYNRSGGTGFANADVGEPLPLSEQWMLILTLLIWAVAVPTVYVVHWRRRRAKPA